MAGIPSSVEQRLFRLEEAFSSEIRRRQSTDQIRSDIAMIAKRINDMMTLLRLVADRPAGKGPGAYPLKDRKGKGHPTCRGQVGKNRRPDPEDRFELLMSDLTANSTNTSSDRQ